MVTFICSAGQAERQTLCYDRSQTVLDAQKTMLSLHCTTVIMIFNARQKQYWKTKIRCVQPRLLCIFILEAWNIAFFFCLSLLCLSVFLSLKCSPNFSKLFFRHIMAGVVQVLCVEFIIMLINYFRIISSPLFAN